MQEISFNSFVLKKKERNSYCVCSIVLLYIKILNEHKNIIY